MAQFIPNTETYSLPPSDPNNLGSSAPSREPVRVILIGSIRGINLLIGILHTLGFAEPGSWSKPQINPGSGQSMRILTKWISR